MLYGETTSRRVGSKSQDRVTVYSPKPGFYKIGKTQRKLLLAHPYRVANPFPMRLRRCTKRLGQDHVVPYATQILGFPRVGSATNELRTLQVRELFAKRRPVESGMKKFLLPDCSPCGLPYCDLCPCLLWIPLLHSLSSVFMQVSSTIDSYNEDRRRLFEALSDSIDV
jgi:hypothetical protein